MILTLLFGNALIAFIFAVAAVKTWRRMAPTVVVVLAPSALFHMSSMGILLLRRLPSTTDHVLGDTVELLQHSQTLISTQVCLLKSKLFIAL